MKYSTDIELASETFELESALLASVIRCESSFDVDAISSKGAVGLMQLMPTTAEYLAEKLNYGDFDLYNPTDNIMLGSFYLKSLIDEYQDETLALCAYNAGPSNVNKWLKTYSDDGKTLNKIPFSETANYLTKINRAKKYYQTKY